MAPQAIAHYRILGQLGRGGMGEVYRALDTKLNREVAIKVIPAKFVEDSARIARFIREAQVLASLNHPNIAAIYGLEDRALVMELVPGETLAERLASGPLPLENAVCICNQIAEALSAAHQKGIVHRDIKPANIKLTPEGKVKVLDFGLAKVASASADGLGDEASTLTAMTEAGVFLGTPAYVSPEQARGHEVDNRGDIWAFGCVLYELLSGRRPFAGRTAADIIAAVLTMEPDWDRVPPNTPPRIRELLRNCLEKDPGRRLQNIALAQIDMKAASPLVTTEKPERDQKAIGSLAVLPFTNVGGDPQMEYLSDGITESIIGRLAQRSQLRVMSRSVVFRYKGRSLEAQEIGKSLRVDVVVSGKVLQRGGTLQVSAEAVDVENGWQLWGGQFRRKVDDLFSLEQAIADEIAGKLSLTLAPGKQAEAPINRYTENVQAYHLYLKGRFYCGKRTEEGLFKGIQYFREAIELDPTYALAHAGLAEAYVPLAFYCHLAPSDACPKGRAASLAALEIDPRLPEARAALGAISGHYERDLAKAEKELRLAISLNPSYSRAHQALAEVLTIAGRLNEAAAEAKRALELDPLALHMNAFMSMTHYFAREFDEAMDYGARTVDMDPGFYPGYFYMALAAQLQGRFVEAAAALEKARALSNNSTLITATLGGVHAASGNVEEARKILRELEETGGRKYVSQTSVAAIHTALGAADQACACLERAYQDRCTWLLRALTVDARFDPLRREPRFQELVRRAGLSGGERGTE
jgi:serine/threonine protein kinase/tetratricopeptide (TPR) repeat protein